MSHLTPELQIVLFDDEEEEPEKKKETKNQSQIFVFDDEDCLDLQQSASSNTDYSKDLDFQRKIMTSEQYRKKCNEIQEKIILGNLINFGQTKKPQGNYFKEAKEKRKSNQLIYERRKSRCIEELAFDPKSAALKVSFVNKDAEANHKASAHLKWKQNIRPIQQSINDEIIVETLVQNQVQNPQKLHEKRPSLHGACIQKKSNLTIQEDKTKNILKVSNFREFLYTQLKSDYSIYLRIKKTQSGLINSTYKIYFQENNRFIIACEKQGFSKYVFSTSEVHIQEDHISYLGKMESNFFGSEFMMYDSGEEYSKTKMLQNYKKQLAYMEYSQPQNSPRKIEAFITTCDNKSTEFTILDNNNNTVGSRWENGHKKNLCKLISKQPTYDPNEYNFKLDFRGLAGIPSTKNFILENQQYPDALIFGRQADKDSYLLKIKAPLSIMQAVGIAMSSIHHKFL